MLTIQTLKLLIYTLLIHVLIACGGGEPQDNPESAKTAEDIGVEDNPASETRQWRDNVRLSAGIGPVTNPSLGMDAIGNGLAIWAQDNGDRHEVRARRFDVSNQAWSEEQVIDNGVQSAVKTAQHNNAKVKESLQLAMASNGFAAVAWISEDTFSTKQQLWANIYHPNNAQWLGPTQITSDLEHDADYPVLSINETGEALITWIQNGIAMSAYANDAWTSPIILDAVATSTDSKLDNHGNIVITWASETVNAVTCVLGQACDETVRLDALSSTPVEPQLAIDGEGNAIVVWTQAVIDIMGLYSARLDAASSVWSSAELLDNTPSSACFITLDGNEQGVFVVAWTQSFNSSCENTGRAIRAKIYTTPSGWFDTQEIDNLGGWGKRLGVDAQGNALLVWSNIHTHWSHKPLTERWLRAKKLAGETDLSIRGFNDGDFNRIAVSMNSSALAIWRHNLRGGLYAQHYQ